MKLYGVDHPYSGRVVWEQDAIWSIPEGSISVNLLMMPSTEGVETVRSPFGEFSFPRRDKEAVISGLLDLAEFIRKEVK